MVRCVSFLVAAVCIAVVASDERTEKSKALLQKCYQETSSTADNLKAFANSESYPDATKCLLKCFMQGQKAITDDGSFDVEAIVKFATEARRGTAEKCKAEATSADLCEKAYQYQKCFLAADSEYVKGTVTRLTA